MVLQTRKWWTRRDIWPLKQPRINGPNRRAPLEGCGCVIRTSTSHSASIHLPFQILAPMQLGLPDVEPPVEKGTLISCYKAEKNPENKLLTQYLPDVLCSGNNIFESSAPLVVWAEMVFRWRRRHWWRDSLHGNLGGQRYETLQGLQSRSNEMNMKDKKCHWGILTFYT